MNFQMQARSSSDGQMYSWISESTPDFAGTGFPGPGSALHVAATQYGANAGAPSVSNGRRSGHIATGTPSIPLGYVVNGAGVDGNASIRLSNTAGRVFSNGTVSGVAAVAGDADEDIEIITSGPVSNTITGLDPGVACAVTTDANGKPVRVTEADPDFDHIIGQCDTQGNLTNVAPELVTILNAKWFGAKGDGTTDDTVALQAALDAAEGRTLWMPPGDYKVTATLNVSAYTKVIGTAGGTTIQAYHTDDVFLAAGPINGSTRGQIKFDSVNVNGNATALALTLSGVSNTTPIVVTTTTPHGLATDGFVQVHSSPGNTAANNAWQITVLSPTTFELNDSVGNGVYTSGAGINLYPRAAIFDLAFSYDTYAHCILGGCFFGIAMDQSEVARALYCTFEGNLIAQVYLLNGDDLTPTSMGGFTNDIELRGCQYGGGKYGIANDGTGALLVDGGNFNSQSIATMRLAHVVGATIRGIGIESRRIEFWAETLLKHTGCGGTFSTNFSGMVCSTLTDYNFAVYAAARFSLQDSSMTTVAASHFYNGRESDFSFQDCNWSTTVFDSLPLFGHAGGPHIDGVKGFYTDTFLSALNSSIIPGLTANSSSVFYPGDMGWTKKPDEFGAIGQACYAFGYDPAISGTLYFARFGRFYRRTSLSVAGGVDVTLSASNGGAYIIEFTGLLTGNISVKWPAALDGLPLIIRNNTTGAYSLTAKVTGQTGFVVPRGTDCQAYFNATDLVQSGFVDGVTTSTTPQTTTSWTDTSATSPAATAPNTSVYSSRGDITTPDNAANQVIYTWTLDNNAASLLVGSVIGKVPGSADAVCIDFKGRFFRDAGGNATNFGTDVVSVESTAGLAGTTADLNISGTTVRLRVSPGANVAIDWGDANSKLVRLSS